MMNVKIIVFLYMTLCSLVDMYQYFGGISSALKMEATVISKVLVLIYQTI